jgi:DNA-binding response OmpR family regulator
MKRILIVDDEFLILYALKKALQKDNREVKSVSTGYAAVREMSSSHYDLCLLDIYLPDMNGLEVMKKIQEESPETKIIVMTASNITEDMRNSINGGAFHFVPKPFNINEIRAIVKHALEEHSELPGGLRSEAGEMTNKRQFERSTVDLNSSYYVVVRKKDSLKKEFINCKIIDISHTGMGIWTDYPLEPGCKLYFTKGTDKKEGVVRWIKMTASDDEFRAGIKFQ